MKKLYRDRWDKKLAGVCGGLGQYLKIDSTIIRLLMILLCLFTGIIPLVIIYIIAWVLMPLGPKTYIQYQCKKLFRSTHNRKIAGICGGIAEMIHTDATMIRIATLVIMILTGVLPLCITYCVGIIIIPERLKNF